jgi:hypothetical protein
MRPVMRHMEKVVGKLRLRVMPLPARAVGRGDLQSLTSWLESESTRSLAHQSGVPSIG